jgi:hypothetical protein
MTVTIRDLLTDPDLFGDQFGGKSWAAWRALLAAFYGLALNRAQQRAFVAITSRARSPKQACKELWLAVGRRVSSCGVMEPIGFRHKGAREFSAYWSQ